MLTENVGGKGLVIRFWFKNRKEAEDFNSLPSQFKKHYLLIKEVNANVFMNRADGKYFKVAQVKRTLVLKTSRRKRPTSVYANV